MKTRRSLITIGLVALGAFAAIACASSPPPVVTPEADLVIPPMPSAKPAPPPSARRPSSPPSRPAPAEPDESEPPSLSNALPAAGMAVPSPVALPCQNDAQCMTHRCNPSYGKCAFPCKSDIDCIPGTSCFTGGGAMAACIPKPP